MVTDAYSNAKSFRRLHQAVVSKEEEAIAILEPSMTCHRAVQSCLEEHLLMLKAIPSTNGRATWIHNHGEKEGWWKKKAITSTKQQLISSLGRELRNHKEKLPLPENNRGRRSKSKHSRQQLLRTMHQIECLRYLGVFLDATLGNTPVTHQLLPALAGSLEHACKAASQHKRQNSEIRKSSFL